MSAGTHRALVVVDQIFNQELADVAVAPLVTAGWDVDRVEWEVGTIENQRAEVRRLENEGPSPEDTLPSLDRRHDYQVIITQFAPINRSALANGNRLRLVAVNRSGLQNVDAATAVNRGIEVFNVPGRNASAVAEHTVALMMTHLRFIATSHAALKQGTWTERFPEPGPRELAEVTVGIVGYGQIGRRVHELLRPFRSRIQIFDPYLDASPADADMMDLDNLLSTSDVVTIHVPLSDQTRDLIGRPELARLKPTSILVNTARAEIVNQGALRDALSSGQLGGAALDVFETEPISANDVLVRSDRTTLTPHLAGTTRQALVQGPLWIAEHLARLGPS
ncbi:MAG: NAD(P)-dependent oxidoreductase [Acidimicrobiales bacterium]